MHGVHERFSIRRDGGGQNDVSPNVVFRQPERQRRRHGDAKKGEEVVRSRELLVGPDSGRWGGMHGVHERFSIRRDGGGQNFVPKLD